MVLATGRKFDDCVHGWAHYGVHYMWMGYQFVPGKALQNYRELLVPATFILGPMGSFCVLLGFLLTYGLDKMKLAHFNDTLDELFDISPEDGDHHVFRHVKHYKVANTNISITDQLLDIFEFGSDTEKQNVLAVINNNYQPKFAKILRMGLADTNNVIRIQSAAILADLEQRQQQELMTLEAAAKATDATPDDKLALAAHYDAMAHSGVVDVVRRNTFLSNAISIYESALRAHPEDAALARKLARAYYRIDEAEKAIEVIHPFAIELTDIPLSLWYLELLFVTHQTEQLRLLAKELAPKVVQNHTYPVKLQRAVQLWAM